MSSRGPGRVIIVSIDFGTTYSGIAWSQTSEPEFQYVIESWPGRGGSTESSEKVPTELRKIAAGHQWGFQIPQTAKRSRVFKLKLDDPSSQAADGVSAEELTKTYLTHLYKHFMIILKEQLTASVVNSTQIHFVVTVPAIWSLSAKQKTQKAAEDAGFRGRNSMYVVSEPEAAAIYTLKNLQPGYLAVGRKFVVCDAGGGTVDLITYAVERVHELKLKEVTEGTGGKCGSSLLNQRFRRHLKQKHGEEYWTDDRLVNALNAFERYKKDWHPNSEPLNIAVDQSLQLRRNRYTVPQEEMKAVFEPIILDILGLIKDQVRLAGHNVSAVLLVGGFGQSAYLKRRVEETLGDAIDILQPPNGWTAVVRGAALLGIGKVAPTLPGVTISSRIARKNYGVELVTTFDKTKHNPMLAYSDRGRKVVRAMFWFIKKGESYPESALSPIDYSVDIPKSSRGQRAPTTIRVYTSDDAIAPVHRNPATKQIATLELNLSKVSESALKEVGTTWIHFHRYHEVSGVIEARYGSAMITYTLKLAGVTHHVVTVRSSD